MPYRIDLPQPGDDIFDRLIELGALDVEVWEEAAAALMPDSVTPEEVRAALGAPVVISPVGGRDAGSVWILRRRPIQAGPVRIVPAGMDAGPGGIQLIDAPAFGTGLHPTTALCLDILGEIVARDRPEAVLDLGTGSGVLALAALRLGVPHALGLDVDEQALRTAAENARINDLVTRLHLVHGGPDADDGTWPLVLANVLAAPLIEMAPSLVRRAGHHGRLVLSGIPQSVEPDVDRVYRHLGMHRVDTRSRAGWVALVMQASW
ncbi:MAG TPA: 50S ribosomal protein L11 methyltransferase [Vicinamibacterales bacterium]